MPRKPSRSILAVSAVLVVVGVAAAAAVLFTSDATAVAKSRATKLTAAGVPQELADGVAAAAASAGGTDVRIVTSSGATPPKAGMYVARNGHGQELVSFFAPNRFTSFGDVHRLLADFKGLFVATAAQPEVAGGPTAHVQARGVVASNVARVDVELTDGSSVAVELLSITRGGSSYFTYATDDAAKLPTVFRAYGANGRLIAMFDVSRATQPPASGLGN